METSSCQIWHIKAVYKNNQKEIQTDHKWVLQANRTAPRIQSHFYLLEICEHHNRLLEICDHNCCMTSKRDFHRNGINMFRPTGILNLRFLFFPYHPSTPPSSSSMVGSSKVRSKLKVQKMARVVALIRMYSLLIRICNIYANYVWMT